MAWVSTLNSGTTEVTTLSLTPKNIVTGIAQTILGHKTMSSLKDADL